MLLELFTGYACMFVAGQLAQWKGRAARVRTAHMFLCMPLLHARRPKCHPGQVAAVQTVTLVNCYALSPSAHLAVARRSKSVACDQRQGSGCRVVAV